MSNLEISLYRYNPETDKFPYMKTYEIEKPARDIMVLDLLHLLKEGDESISYRRSCREGVCGSDGMNINGKNGLACITPLSSVLKKNELPFMRVKIPEGMLPEDYVIIKPGDILWSISYRIYGNPFKYIEIYKENKDQISNPDLIFPGQIFTLPKED